MDRDGVRHPTRRRDTYRSPWPDRVHDLFSAMAWITVIMTALIPFTVFCVMWLIIVGKLSCMAAGSLGVLIWGV